MSEHDREGAPRWLGRALLAGLVPVLFLGLTGCGSSDGNPYGLAEFRPGSTSAPSSAPGAASSTSAGSVTPSAAPTFRPAPAPSGELTYRPADPLGEGAWVEKGRIAAQTSTQKLVGKAVMAYLTQRVELSNTWQVDQDALAGVASGQALTNAQDRAAGQQQADRRSIGRFVLNLSSITVTGDQAQAAGCPFDATAEVDPDGNILVYPPGGVQLSLDLVRTGDVWRVTTFPTVQKTCDWRRS